MKGHSMLTIEQLRSFGDVYSCRVDGWPRLAEFLHRASVALDGTNETFLPSQYDGARDGLEFATTLRRTGVMALMALVPDSHAMQQTLRPGPLSENSLERGWSLEPLGDEVTR